MTKRPEPDHSIEAQDPPQVEDVGNPTPLSPAEDIAIEQQATPAKAHKHTK